VEQIKKELPASTPPPDANLNKAEKKIAKSLPNGPEISALPVPVRIVASNNGIPQLLQTIAAAALSPLGTAALVLLLAIFMLLQREDLRGRIIRLIGQGHISETTRAMDDAAHRVARYLSMQFLVNTGYAIVVGVGLYFIGVPNAILWGAVAGVLRFIPYVGPWIGAAVPVLLSFAISTSWLTPIFTVSLFAVLELINSNALEPWLYGSSTGVSPIALIIAALFWTWLWGPVGLLLSTPMTVCLAVMGRHVPKLEFLSILLSEEEALSPAEECYHRLLAPGAHQANDLAETYLNANSLTALYDNMLLPVVIATERDVQRGALEEKERSSVYESLVEMTEDFGGRPSIPSELEADKTIADKAQALPPAPTCRVVCVPAHAERDQIAGLMLVQLLRQQNFDAENFSAQLASGEIVEAVAKTDCDAICISVVPPSTLIHARYLTRKLRERLRDAKIVVGFWGATENIASTAQGLRKSGADETVVSFAEAVVQLAKFSGTITDEMAEAPLPENEEGRLQQLIALQVLDTPNEPFFDTMAARLVRVFEVPMALIAFIDAEREWFKSQVGLPEEIAEARYAPRALSICAHTVASNELLVVEDIARDKRFANNPLLRGRGIRFYAGVPLRVNKFPIGSICLLDTKPRRFSEENRRLLHVMADEVTEELERRLPPKIEAPAL
jgi:predicted PurR-regulated permease PerM/GAF domain-containing protein